MEGPRVKDAAMFTTIVVWKTMLTQTRIAAKDRDDLSKSVNAYYHRVQVLNLG